MVLHNSFRIHEDWINYRVPIISLVPVSGLYEKAAFAMPELVELNDKTDMGNM